MRLEGDLAETTLQVWGSLGADMEETWSHRPCGYLCSTPGPSSAPRIPNLLIPDISEERENVGVPQRCGVAHTKLPMWSRGLMSRPFKPMAQRGRKSEAAICGDTALGVGRERASRTSWARRMSTMSLHGTASQAEATEETPVAPSPMLALPPHTENSDALV